MIAEIEGNLLDEFETGRVNVLVHQTNCFCTMGSGIARQIRERYPKAYERDRATEKGDRAKLGTFSIAKIDNSKFIINLYGQYTFSSKPRETSYDALYDGLKLLHDRAIGMAGQYVIGVPYQIGCGLGGGSWLVVRAILEDIFGNSPLELLIVKLHEVS